MDTNENINQVMQRTRQYEFQDGLRDIQFALTFLALGIVSWYILDMHFAPLLVKLSQIRGTSASWLLLLLVFIPGLLGFAMWGIMHLLRKHWLWRESGMVKPEPIMVPRWASVSAVMFYIAAMVISIRFSSTNFVLNMLFVASGWATGIMLFGMSRHVGLRRYLWIAILGALGSTFLLFTPFTFGQNVLIFGILWAVLFAVPGISSLIRTIKAYREVTHE